MSITADDINAFLPDEAALSRLACALLPALTGGLTIYLSGPVGAGKTAFVRAVLRAGGIEGTIRSPTYTLVEVYTLSNLYFYHFDLYRFSEADEWYSSGFDEMFGPQSVAMIEWPEKAGAAVPPADICIAIDHVPHGRQFRASASNPQGEACLRTWKFNLPPPTP